LLHAQALGQHDLGEFGGRSSVGMGEGYLGVRADARHRGPQLVGGVGDKLLLAQSCSLEASQHSIHRGGEPGDLIAAGGLRNSAVQLLCRDLIDLSADRFDRGQSPSDDSPCRHGQQ